MLTFLVILTLLLLISAIIAVEAGDVLKAKLHMGPAAREELPLPFLIYPVETPHAGAGHADATMIERASEPEIDAEPWWPAYEARSLQASGLAASAVAEMAPDDGATIMFRRPVDEALQILPGRFRVLAGETGRDEIRFFGNVGEPARIVIGRTTGSPQRVITLSSPTVSRRHAQLEFTNGRWVVENLSRTNPVLVNDEALPTGHDHARTLSDGDTLELGEVVLRFSAN